MFYIVLQLAIAKDIEMFENTILIWTRKNYHLNCNSLNVKNTSCLNFVADKVSYDITCLNAIRQVYTSNAS